MNYLRKKLDEKNLEKENNDIYNNNNSKKEKEILDNNNCNKANKINYFNKSSKNNQNKVKNNSVQNKFCINISETKKTLENKNINRINNMDNIKKENIKRTELFKPKSKNKYIQNIYSNTTNTNTNNTNKKSSNNFSKSINSNNNKQNDNKDDKIFVDSNSYINQKENNLFESSELDQFSPNFFSSNNHKINNKRNKTIHSLDFFKSYSKNSTDNIINDLDSQTYSILLKKNDVIKVNMVKNSEKENSMNKNSKSTTNLKTNLKNNNNLKISRDYCRIKERKLLGSLSSTNSEKNLKLINTNNYSNNMRLSNNIAKSTKNTLSIKIYLPGYHNKNKSIKKKTQQSFNYINNQKESKDNIKIDINRSLDIKQKKFYSISSRDNNHRKRQENKINPKNKNININIDLCPKKKNQSLKKFENNSVIVPEYKIKLDDIKSRIYKLLNIYSLIALKSVNNSNDISKIKDINENDKI